MSNSNKGDGEEGGRQMTVTRAAGTATATMWAMATVTRLVSKEKGKSEGGKGKFDGDGGKAMVNMTWVADKEKATTTTRVMVMKTKEVGEEEGNSKGGKINGDSKEGGNGK